MANRETSLIDPAGVVTTTAYSAGGDTITTVADSVQTDRTFDGLGRPLTETVAGVGVTNPHARCLEAAANHLSRPSIGV